MPAGNVEVTFTGDDRDLIRALKRQEKEIDRLKGKLTETRKQGKATQGVLKQAFDPKHLMKFGAGMLGAGGAIAAIAAVNRHLEVTYSNMREISRAGVQAAHDMVAFAALQEGGTKAERVQAAAALGAKYGVSNLGEVWNTVQALQSAREGRIDLGMASAETVFAAANVGIPVERGRELEVLDAAQGQAPGMAIRRAYAAGQASARDPSVLAGAAPGLTFWQDKQLGFAAAGVLAGSVKPDELQTYVKAAGIGLSGVSTLAETFEALGVGKGTRLERLKALQQAGLDTTEELKAAGLSEMRQQQALATLVQNLPAVMRIGKQIEKQAVPGLFASQRAGVEAELPGARLQAQIDALKAADKVTMSIPKELAVDDPAIKAMWQEQQDRIARLAWRRLGGREEHFIGGILAYGGDSDLFDETGRPTATFRQMRRYRMLPGGFANRPEDWPQLKRKHGSGAATEAYIRERQRVIDEFGLADSIEDFVQSAKELRDAAKDMREAAKAQERAAANSRPQNLGTLSDEAVTKQGKY